MFAHAPIRKLVIAISAVALLLFCLFPFVQILSTSLKYQQDWGNPSLIPTRVNLDAYRELLGFGSAANTASLPPTIVKLLENPKLTDAQRDAIKERYISTSDIFPFLRYLANSVGISAVAASVSLVLAVFGAYALSRLRFGGRAAIQRSVLLVYMIGGVLLMVPLYQMAIQSGLARTPQGSMIALVLVYIMQTLPVSLYMLGNYFRSIPAALEEAAAMDGYSRIEAILYVILPLSVPMLATVFAYSFIIAWNEYLFASVFLRQFSDVYTLPLGLQSLFYSKTAIWDRIMAASMLTLLPVLALFMIAMRSLTGGLTEGGVKE
jgi:multiple sugar transport system permease protein